MGGAVAAIESGYMKQELVASHARRRARIESGDERVDRGERVHRDGALAADR